MRRRVAPPGPGHVEGKDEKFRTAYLYVDISRWKGLVQILCMSEKKSRLNTDCQLSWRLLLDICRNHLVIFVPTLLRNARCDAAS